MCQDAEGRFVADAPGEAVGAFVGVADAASCTSRTSWLAPACSR